MRITIRRRERHDSPEPPIADISTMRLEQLRVVEPVVVDGAMCARMHFNPPDAMFCRECGVSMRELTKNIRLSPGRRSASFLSRRARVPARPGLRHRPRAAV